MLMVDTFVSYRVRFLRKEKVQQVFFDDSEQAKKFAEKQSSLIKIDKVLMYSFRG